MKNVIHLFGGSGSGTTTLGKMICEELGYTQIDTDDYYWMPTERKYTQKRSREERIARMQEDIRTHENVVVSGSLAGWGDALIPWFTLAVRIELDPDVRIARLIQREKERYGARIEPGGDMYQQHFEFVAWAKLYDTAGVNIRSKARHDVWQKQLTCELLQLDGADTVENNFAKVKQILDGKRVLR